jgi:hypothetical protein
LGSQQTLWGWKLIGGSKTGPIVAGITTGEVLSPASRYFRFEAPGAPAGSFVLLTVVRATASSVFNRTGMAS